MNKRISGYFIAIVIIAFLAYHGYNKLGFLLHERYVKTNEVINDFNIRQKDFYLEKEVIKVEEQNPVEKVEEEEKKEEVKEEKKEEVAKKKEVVKKKEVAKKPEPAKKKEAKKKEVKKPKSDLDEIERLLKEGSK